MSKNIQNLPEGPVRHYFISNIFYIFVLVVCPVFIYLHTQHFWFFSTLGFRETFISFKPLDLFLTYIRDVFSIVLSYLLWPTSFILLILFYITISRNNPNPKKLKESSNFQKKIIALTNKISEKTAKIKKELYLLRHLIIIVLVFIYIVILAVSHDKGMDNGRAAAKSIIKNIRDNKRELTPIELENETIHIYTLVCDKNICSGIQGITNEDGAIELKSKNYKAEYYSNPL